MKKISAILIFIAFIQQAFSQVNKSDLPSEFKDVAIKAFEKVSPATRQWFINTAKQHPTGSFDTVWAKKKLKEKFTATDMSSTGELFMVMMAYQKMLNKEAREDRKIATGSKQLDLASKKNKLKLDNAKIDQQKKEANEKANNAMTAAQTDLWIGIVSGNSAVASGGLQQSNQRISPVRLSPQVTQKIDSPKVKEKKPNSDQQVQKAEQDAKEAEEARKASEEHKKKVKDAIQKLLDQMARLKPNTSP